MKTNKKKENKQDEIHPLTSEEIVKEELLYQSCKKPISIAWKIFAISATIYLSSAIFAKSAIDKIPIQKPIVESLDSYKQSEQYQDYITTAQKEALSQFTAGEISYDDYEYVIKTLSNDKKFEEFLRSLEDDKFVQQTIAKYDKYEDQINEIGKKYSALTITALSSLLVSTIILAKYRFREMEIEENRKKREENQMQ